MKKPVSKKRKAATAKDPEAGKIPNIKNKKEVKVEDAMDSEYEQDPMTKTKKRVKVEGLESGQHDESKRAGKKAKASKSKADDDAGEPRSVPKTNKNTEAAEAAEPMSASMSNTEQKNGKRRSGRLSKGVD